MGVRRSTLFLVAIVIIVLLVVAVVYILNESTSEDPEPNLYNDVILEQEEQPIRVDIIDEQLEPPPSVIEEEEPFDWSELVDVTMPYKLEVFLDQLEVPWAIEMADDGRILFTERPGRVRLVRDGELVDAPLITLSDTYHRSEGGLLGLALHPQFTDNGLFYVHQTYRDGQAVKNRVLRLQLNGDEAVMDKVIIDDLPGANNHNGGRLKIGPDDKLYITTGEIYEIHLAQQLDNLGGKLLRLELNGTIPADNPFEQSPVYSWGHRNPQGLAWHLETNELYSSEHGQTAHDEINIIQPGNNYGWPIIEGDKQSDEMRSPILHSGSVTWAPSGITFIANGPWENDMLVANLRGEQLLRLVLNPDDPTLIDDVIPLYKGEYGRIRDVYESSDGVIYFLTNNRDGRGKPSTNDDRIMMLVPQW